jgi:hypothetical protein
MPAVVSTGRSEEQWGFENGYDVIVRRGITFGDFF